MYSMCECVHACMCVLMCVCVRVLVGMCECMGV